ncbi:MAG TPA: Stf0 family sulfotransferase [Stellaceae bacterium]|nr:Stf0 family sulfotransferase [Stellaceae bacterium]
MLARYVVFSAQRTGSSWLCGYLLQRGLGVPFEYLNPVYVKRIATRLGMSAELGVDIAGFMARLQPLRTRHGIFGMKLQPHQLRMASAGNPAEALAILRRFDKVILLRRRDQLLQAISLARASLTDQWQLYGDDETLDIDCADDVLFEAIGAGLRSVRDNEHYMTELAAGLKPEVVRTLWYEDLSDPSVLEATADWLWAAVGDRVRRPGPDPTIELPKKMDEARARGIKRRYMSFIGAA